MSKKRYRMAVFFEYEADVDIPIEAMEEVNSALRYGIEQNRVRNLSISTKAVFPIPEPASQVQDEFKQ